MISQKSPKAKLKLSLNSIRDCLESSKTNLIIGKIPAVYSLFLNDRKGNLI